MKGLEAGSTVLWHLNSEMVPQLEEISRQLWHLHCGLITQLEAEKVIFPIIDALVEKGEASWQREGVAFHLVES